MAKSKMLRWVAAAVLSAIGNCSAFAADDHVKIGVLTDLTGPYSAITGKGSVAAARLAIEDFGGSLLGKPIELVVADHTSKPDIGATWRGNGTTSMASMRFSMAPDRRLPWPFWKSHARGARSSASRA
jgi:hypothetical protein